MGELVSVLEVGGTMSNDAFVFTGIVLEGAGWSPEASTVTVTDALFVEMPKVGVRYEHQSTFKAPDSSIVCPVYLNSTRTVLVTNWRLNTPADEKNVTFLQRGIALVLWFSG